MLELLIAFVMALSAALPTFNAPAPEKELVDKFVEQASPYFIEQGVDVEFTEPNVIYMALSGGGNYVAATQKFHNGCYQTVVLNPQLRSKNSPYFGTEFWRAAVVHEMVHVQQGAGCLNNVFLVENAAEIGMYSVLAAMAADGHQEAEDALIYSLWRDSILAAMDLKYQGGADRVEVAAWLESIPNMDEKHFRYFTSLSPEWLKAKGQSYWTATILTLLLPSKDTYTNRSLQSEIDLTELNKFISQFK